MIDGVNILSSIEKTTYRYAFITAPSFIVLACIIILVVIGICIIGNTNKEGYQILGGMIAMVSLLIGFPIFIAANSVPYRSYMEYKVTIDDSVLFTEFNNRYQILSSEGEIYTIIERQQIIDTESDIE